MLLTILWGQHSSFLFGSPDLALDVERTQRYIASVLRDCAELEAVGPRYSPGGLPPEYLVQYAGHVYLAMTALIGRPENLNARRDAFNGPPEQTGGLRALLQSLEVDIDPAWAAERLPDHAVEGESPLMQAAYYGHTTIVRLLIDRGAKVRYRTENGEDALTFAEMGKHTAIREMIQEAWKRKRPHPA